MKKIQYKIQRLRFKSPFGGIQGGLGLVLLLMLFVQQASASGGVNYIRVLNPKIAVESGRVSIDMVVRADNLPLSTSESLALEFSIEGDGYRRVLPPVIYTGKQRYMFDKRNRLVSGQPEVKPYYVHKGKLKNSASLRYKLQVPYKEWMDGGKLSVRLVYHDCCSKNLLEQKVFKLKIESGKLKTKEPIVVPEVVPAPVVKKEPRVHTAIVSAYLNYPVNVHEVRPYYMNNAYELRKVDSLMRSVLYNPNVEVRSLVVTGYASPEGSYESNTRLARNRAEGFREYIRGYYNVSPFLMRTDWVAEDWTGLGRMVMERNIPNMQEVLSVVRSGLPPDAREQRLKALHNGTTYRYLLNELYPYLRRIEIKAEYTIIND